MINSNTAAQQHNSTIVIGGGIAGLTVAWRLKEAGLKVTLLEQSSHVGGCIRTIHEGGYLLEIGPNTFLNSSRALWDLAASVGIRDLKIETPQEIGKRRYIFKKGRLYLVPNGPGLLFSSLLSFGARLRILKEPFIKPCQPANTPTRQDANTPGRRYDESLASFIRRRLGPEVLDTLVTPFVSGIYAGDPESLSINAVFPKLVEVEKKYGSIFRGMKALKGDLKSGGLGSFRSGMATLPMAIESHMEGSVIKSARAVEIRRLVNKYSVLYEQEGEIITLLSDNVVVATPAYAASQIVGNISSVLKEELGQIKYAPIAVAHTGYKKEDLPDLAGFGFLVPRKNRVRILGCLWSSSLFPERAPSAHVLLTNFLGGELDSEACDLSNEDILSIVQKDLAKTLKVKNSPEFACVTKYTHAIPQYLLGHVAKIARIESTLAKIKGLFLTGAYFTGVSVAATIEHAERIVNQICRLR